MPLMLTGVLIVFRCTFISTPALSEAGATLYEFG
jgi:hypothetical protein